MFFFPKPLLVLAFITANRELNSDRGQRFLKEPHGEVLEAIAASDGSQKLSGSDHDGRDDKLLSPVGFGVNSIC